MRAASAASVAVKRVPRLQGRSAQRGCRRAIAGAAMRSVWSLANACCAATRAQRRCTRVSQCLLVSYWPLGHDFYLDHATQNVCWRGFAHEEMIYGLWLINLGVACALQAPPGRKGLKVLRTDSPRTPHAAAAVRKAAARLAFTGLVATAGSFAPAAAAKGGGGGADASSYSYASR